MDKKSYLDQMQEITKDNLFDGFLGYGLFAEKILPFLTDAVISVGYRVNSKKGTQFRIWAN